VRAAREGAFRPLLACGQFTPEDICAKKKGRAGPDRVRRRGALAKAHCVV